MDKNINQNPLVSILMITYNQGRYILDAIKSVQSQDYTNWELIVMDDASTDDTEEVVKSIAKDDERIKYFKQATNQYIIKNRNDGLTHASGNFLAILDSDDIWSDDKKLSKQMTFILDNPDCVVVGTQTETIDENGSVTGKIICETEDISIRQKILRRNQFVNSSVLMLTYLVREIGGYSDQLEIGEDYDLFLRLGKKGKLANLRDFCTQYRVHKKGVTKERKTKGAINHLSIINKYSKDYPQYTSALIKAFIRIIISKI